MSRRALPLFPAAVLVARLIVPDAALAAPAAPVRNLAEAERLIASPPASERDRPVLRWARDAAADQLLFLLRHAPSELGSLEAPLIERTLDCISPRRASLIRRLQVRLALAAPKQAKKLLGSLASSPEGLRLRPYASPFRVAALLPASSDYEGYARSVRAGLEAGLALDSAASSSPLTLEVWNTGDDEPARAAAALDSALERSEAVVGELLSAPTMALAAGARIAGVPLLSPTATDESIGAVGERVMQIGPSAYQRGDALARALIVPAHGTRVGVLLSSALQRSELARGFIEVATTLGASVVWRDMYPARSLNFQSQVQALAAKKIDVLLWDGESSEAEALFRRLGQDKVTVRIAGGENLAPEQFHAETRTLLEGARVVGDDWRLPPAAQAALDSVLRARGQTPTAALAIRGYLAARLIAEAVHGGALCAGEIAAALRLRVATEPYLAQHGFLDGAGLGATIPVLTVTRGRAVGDP